MFSLFFDENGGRSRLFLMILGQFAHRSRLFLSFLTENGHRSQPFLLFSKPPAHRSHRFAKCRIEHGGRLDDIIYSKFTALLPLLLSVMDSCMEGPYAENTKEKLLSEDTFADDVQ